ncbi:hypothetical protein [Caldisalinibacter kiritimatiensis]|nr:hypothetical protein [Caldisalinibacter kiritimatiensis]
MDDFQDLDNSFLNKFIKKSGRGILAYCLIIFSFSCLLNAKLAVSLFISSYIIGMFSNINRTLPLGLKGYHESIIVTILGILLIGYKEMLSSFILILIIQLIDDYIDMSKDIRYKSHNFVIILGKVESTLVIIILLLIEYKLSIVKLVYGLIIILLFELLEYYLLRRS